MIDSPAAAPALRATSFADLQAQVQRWGFPAWRAKQIYQWVFGRDARAVDEMTNIPAEIRERLDSGYRWGGIAELKDERKSDDGTIKFLFRLEDDLCIESVLMPEEDHYALCVSSQAGCALNCAFCLTGALVGPGRNLDAGEIVDQVLWSRRRLREREELRPLRNLVFMGMGEPLLNIPNVLAALRLILSPAGMGFSPRRVTVSTAGIVPGMDQLGASGLGVGLAISLNASTDDVRARLMPIARRYPLEELIAACQRYPLTHRRRITFEYVLLDGINDSLADARRLVSLLHGIPCKINLIPLNEHPSLAFRRPPVERIEAFRELLAEKYFTATVRVSKGQDIEAACGQLAGKAKINSEPEH